MSDPQGTYRLGTSNEELIRLGFKHQARQELDSDRTAFFFTPPRLGIIGRKS